MKRILSLCALILVPLGVLSQSAPQLAGLPTAATDSSATRVPLYKSNGAGVPGSYSGPGYGQSITDPTFGTTLSMPPKPTDCAGGCSADTEGEAIPYPKVMPWSADKKFFADQATKKGWINLYDATVTPMKFLYRIQVSADTNAYAPEGNDLASDFSNWQWSRDPTKPARILYTGSASSASGRVEYKSFDPVAYKSTVIWDARPTMALYPGCTQINNEREGEYSDKDNIAAFTCNTGGNNDQNAIMVYNPTTGKVVSKAYAKGGLCSYTATGACLVSANYVTVSPGCGGHDPYVLINWNGGSHDYNWVRGTGTDLLDLNLNYLGGATGTNNHGDPGCDADGNDVFIQSADQYLTNYQFHMFAVVELSQVKNNGVVGSTSIGGAQHFFRLPSTYCYCTGFTLSMRSTQGAGMGLALLSNYDSNTTPTGTGALFSTQNLFLKIQWSKLSADNTSDQLPGTPDPFVQLGFNYSEMAAPNGNYDGDYFAQPNTSSNIDGTAVAFTSTLDHCNVAPCALPLAELPKGMAQYGVLYTQLPIAAVGPPPVTVSPPPVVSSPVVVPASTWVKVAAEDESVSLPAYATYRYGAGSSWTTPQTTKAAATITASNTTFSDPDVGVVKELDVQSIVSNPPTPATIICTSTITPATQQNTTSCKTP